MRRQGRCETGAFVTAHFERTAERIERLESQIEDLGAAIAQSRKLMLLGKVAAMAGLPLFMASAFGLPFVASPIWLVSGVALGLGGLVLAGASQSSTESFAQRLARTQAERAEAIDELAPRDVSIGPDLQRPASLAAQN